MKTRWMAISPQDFESVVGLAIGVLRRHPVKTMRLLQRCLPGGPQDHAAVVVEDSEGIVGYIVYRHTKGEDKSIKIKHLAVADHRRRAGCATQMLDWIIDKYAESRRQVVADVSEKNTAAQKLFSKLGFRAQLVKTDNSSDKYRFNLYLGKQREKTQSEDNR